MYPMIGTRVVVCGVLIVLTTFDHSESSQWYLLQYRCRSLLSSYSRKLQFHHFQQYCPNHHFVIALVAAFVASSQEEDPLHRQGRSSTTKEVLPKKEEKVLFSL